MALAGSAWKHVSSSGVSTRLGARASPVPFFVWRARRAASDCGRRAPFFTAASSVRSLHRAVGVAERERARPRARCPCLPPGAALGLCCLHTHSSLCVCVCLQRAPEGGRLATSGVLLRVSRACARPVVRPSPRPINTSSVVRECLPRSPEPGLPVWSGCRGTPSARLVSCCCRAARAAPRQPTPLFNPRHY